MYRFEPMLGPAEHHPIGSLPWAERIGQRLQVYLKHSEQTQTLQMQTLAPLLTAILDATPNPWMIWPEQNPARTPEAWFELVTGQSVDSVAKLIEAHDPTSSLIPRLQAATAKGAPMDDAGKNQYTVAVAHSHSTNVTSSTSIARILARLARDRPDILAAYERGEFTSARAAGIAAGIIKPPTGLLLLRKAWSKASAAERRAFLDEIGEGA